MSDKNLGPLLDALREAGFELDDVRVLPSREGEGVIIMRPMTPAERAFWAEHAKPDAERVYVAFRVDATDPLSKEDIEDYVEKATYCMAHYDPTEELVEAT